MPGDWETGAIDIAAMTNSILKRYAIVEETDGFRFHTSIPESAPALGDGPKIAQVIYNLISNAVNYTGEDKRVHITVTNLPGKVRFEVRDTGAGIEEEEIENIWERYYKSEKAHKRSVVGTGLGLAIVKNILEQHHADYGVVSTKGKGSIFWFELKNC